MKTSLLLIAILTFQLAGVRSQNHQIDGTFQGQRIISTVDHPLAVEYFNQCLEETLYCSRLEKSLNEELTRIGNEPLSEKSLTFLAKRVSVDFATLYFVRKIYSEPKHKHAIDMYHQNLTDPIAIQNHDRAKEHLYVFVPGLFYKRHPETGADFAAQRKLCNQYGLKTHLIETNEIGTVKENALIIAKELKKLSQQHRSIILISASKGGPDVAYALGNIMKKEETTSVKAWLSLGGVLRGSYIADEHVSGFSRWFTKSMLFFIGGDITLVEDLTRAESMARQSSIKLPEHLLVLHYVGAPLSGQVTADAKKTYQKLSQFGPNDGLTTLIDQLTPQGIVIPELGLDHYYRHPEIHERSMALVSTVTQLLTERELP